MDFINNNPELLGLVSYILVNVLNAITPHWSKASGVAKGVLFVTEVLSIFTSKGQKGLVKLPLQTQKKNQIRY